MRPSTISRALLDASALIGVIKGEQDFACLKPLLAAVDRGEITLVESTAILAEVVPDRGGSASEMLIRAQIRTLLESPSTELVDVSTAIARRAGALRSSHGLKTWDAIHLATAIAARVDVLVVRDHKFPEGPFEGVYVTGPFDLDDDKLPLR